MFRRPKRNIARLYRCVRRIPARNSACPWPCSQTGQTDEALSLAQTALAKNPDDPELNAVMGEILCARNEYADAEPFLKKSLNTKPEFVSRVHALLGNVYAKTNRTQEAIAELKLGLESDRGRQPALSDCASLYEGGRPSVGQSGF